MANWESIVREHGPMAFDTAWRLLANTADAEDVVQDALLDAFRLHSQQAIVNWGGLLRQLAARRAIDRLRTRPAVKPFLEEPAAATSNGPEVAAREVELAEWLRSAIATLPDRESEVFSLQYLGEMTSPEIAQTLGITVGAVAVALHKARTKLKLLLSSETVFGRRPLE